jgi:1-acyl-sn-glycerol-3-phosphate acyltransferase
MTLFTNSLGHLDVQTRLLVRTINFSFRLMKTENDHIFKTIPDPVIFAFNHNNYWETLLVGSYFLTHRTGKKLAFITDWMFGRLPLFAWLLKRIDPIYTYRKNARYAFLSRHRQKADGQEVCRACLERLHNGQSLGIFPEGARNHDPHCLKRGRKGLGEIALRSGAPVLPVGIDFPRRLRSGVIPRFSPVMLRFGAPLTFPDLGEAFRTISREARVTPRERQRLQVVLSAQATHRVMVELARLSGKAYPFASPRIPPMAQSYLEKTTGKGAF